MSLQSTNGDEVQTPPWPMHAELLEMELVESTPADATAWAEFKGLERPIAIVRRRASAPAADDFRATTGRIRLLAVAATPEEHADAIDRTQTWLDATAASGAAPSLLLTLHGAKIVWRPGRVAVFAPADRLESVLRSILEASAYEAELSALESLLDAGWKQVHDDARMAFDFGERDVRRRASLAAKFQELVGLRSRFVRLAPSVLAPHVYPPTLASQVAERLRERTRMHERLELLEGKLEAQERVYELCGQRSSEFMLGRTGHHLEWAIIILLLAQTTLLVVEFLSYVGTS
ncbi:MAG: hypothetical protein U0939_19620 [Pirellulales bacterium]